MAATITTATSSMAKKTTTLSMEGHVDDILDGELLVADTMIGGAGNDTYYVDDAGDVVDDKVPLIKMLSMSPVIWQTSLEMLLKTAPLVMDQVTQIWMEMTKTTL